MEEPSESWQQLEQEQALPLQVGPRGHPRGRRPEQPDGRLVPGARQVGGRSEVGLAMHWQAMAASEPPPPEGGVRFAYQIRLSICIAFAASLVAPSLPSATFYKWSS